MTTVLLVDQSRANRRLVHTLLSLKGHEVVEADDGEQAIAVARRSAPAIVIADLTPEGGGDDTVRRLRENPDTAGIPVVAYGGDDTPEVARACRVNRIVAQPADPGPLLEAVDSLIAERTAGSGRHAPRPALPGAPATVRLLLDAAPVGVVLGTADGSATYVNPALTRIVGAPERQLLGDGWLNRLGALGRRETLRALREAAAHRDGADSGWHCRDRVSRAGRPPQWLDVTLRRLPAEDGFVAFVVDVTAAAAGEGGAGLARDRATSRLGTLRRFAAGVAHGYSNALAAVLSYAEFLRDRVGDAQARGRIDRETGHDLLNDVETILAAGRRATELTHLLQSFGQRGREITPSVVDLDAALRAEMPALRERLGGRIDLRVDLAGDLRPVVADTGQVGQILRYLTDNARDAMPDGGSVEIRTAAAGDRVRLTVRDSGPGMAPAVARRATEPFFTTKPDVEAAGLGLTAVAGMVAQAGGDLSIETAPGAGTAVHVHYPVAAPTGERPPEPAPPARDATETVVVVDDEESMRSLVHRILTRAGYQVLTAAGAAEALELVRSSAGPVHCLVTDLAMPGMPGTELARRLRVERPELAVLYMSGYAEPLLHHVGTADDRVNLLPKPFTRAELLTAVRATLHEHRAARRRAGT